MALLQMAHYTFDITFPQGTKGIVNFVAPKCSANQTQGWKERLSATTGGGTKPLEKCQSQ